MNRKIVVSEIFKLDDYPKAMVVIRTISIGIDNLCMYQVVPQGFDT